MIILPAIDIQEGECVRLTKGDFATVERVAEDPVATATAFKEAGAEWLHMVDLDGAKNAQMMNRDVFISVARETELKIELGGGIRDAKTAAYYLDNGIERVILGSAAVKNPKLIAELVHEYGDRIAVGIDAENGLVKTEGWQDTGKVNFITLAREMMYIGVHYIIYTDISRDGTLTGPNLEELARLRDSARVNIIASGGISNIGDIRALGGLNLYGAICGKAIYRETLDLKEAIAVAAEYPAVAISFDDDPDEMEESGAADRESRPDRRQEQNRQNNSRSGNAPKREGGNSRPPRGGRTESGNEPKRGGQQSAGKSGGNPRGGNANRSGRPAGQGGQSAQKPGGQPGQKQGNRPAKPANQPKAGGTSNGQPKTNGPKPANGTAADGAKPEAKRRRSRRGSRGRGRGGNGGVNGGQQNGGAPKPASNSTPKQGE